MISSSLPLGRSSRRPRVVAARRPVPADRCTLLHDRACQDLGAASGAPTTVLPADLVDQAVVEELLRVGGASGGVVEGLEHVGDATLRYLQGRGEVAAVE